MEILMKKTALQLILEADLCVHNSKNGFFILFWCSNFSDYELVSSGWALSLGMRKLVTDA
jgi:hypothetical protein